MMTPRTAAGRDTQLLRSAEAWFSAHGGVRGSVRLAWAGEGMDEVGMLATADIAEGEPVLRVPSALVIDELTALRGAGASTSPARIRPLAGCINSWCARRRCDGRGCGATRGLVSRRERCRCGLATRASAGRIFKVGTHACAAAAVWLLVAAAAVLLLLLPLLRWIFAYTTFQ